MLLPLLRCLIFPAGRVVRAQACDAAGYSSDYIMDLDVAAYQKLLSPVTKAAECCCTTLCSSAGMERTLYFSRQSAQRCRGLPLSATLPKAPPPAGQQSSGLLLLSMPHLAATSCAWPIAWHPAFLHVPSLAAPHFIGCGLSNACTLHCLQETARLCLPASRALTTAAPVR